MDALINIFLCSAKAPISCFQISLNSSKSIWNRNHSCSQAFGTTSMGGRSSSMSIRRKKTSSCISYTLQLLQYVLHRCHLDNNPFWALTTPRPSVHVRRDADRVVVRYLLPEENELLLR